MYTIYIICILYILYFFKSYKPLFLYLFSENDDTEILNFI